MSGIWTVGAIGVLWLAATAALTVVYLEWHDFGSGLLGCAMLLAFAAGVWCVISGWRRSRSDRVWVGLLLGTGAVVATVVGVWIGAAQQASTRRVGDGIVAALERHRARAGAYPRRLDELVPRELAHVPSTAVGVFAVVPFEYEPRAADGTYALWFSLPSFQYCSYAPGIGWRVDD